MEKEIAEGGGGTMDPLPLVSVVIPCFNVEHRMKHFMESLLRQTYRKLELIFIDDGSTDQTAACIRHYKPLFEKRNMIVNYIYQKNSGLGSAIHHGLKEIHGEFLAWPDPDDWLSDESIERKLEFLLAHPEYGVVTSNAYIYEAHNMSRPISRVAEPVTEETTSEYQFELLLRYRSIFCPGCHLMRVSALQDVNSEFDIFEARRGQNFQLLLPVYYKYKRYFLDECLYHYVIYADSMSRGDDTLDKEMIREDELLEILIETLNRIQMPERERDKYIQMVQADSIKTRFWKAYIYGDTGQLHSMYKKLSQWNAVSYKIAAANVIGHFALSRRISISVNKIRHTICRELIKSEINKRKK